MSSSNRGIPPPHDLDAERAVLSAVLLRPERLRAVAQIVAPADFYSDQHRRIWLTLAALDAERIPIDSVALSRRLQEQGRLAEVGGPAYIAQIIDATPAIHNVDAHAAGVHDLARRRRLISECQRIAAEGYGDVGELDRWLEEVGSSLARIVDDDVARRRGDEWGWIDAAALAEPLDPVPWVIPELQIGPGRPGSLQSYGAGAKSLVAGALAVAVASARPAFGSFRVTRPGRVRVWDFEMGRRAWQRRFQRLAFAMDVDLAALPLEVSPLPRTCLTSSGALDAFKRGAEGITLGIVDSFRAAARGADENASDVRQYLDLLLEVSEATGIAWLVIHHVGKDKPHGSDARQKGRGASAIFDAWGTVLDLERKDDDVRKLTMTKPHPEGTGPCEPFYVEIVDVPNGADPRAGVLLRHKTVEQVQPPEASRLMAEDDRSRLVAGLAANGGEARSQEQLRAWSNLGTKEARRALADSLVRGEVVEVRVQGRTRYRLGGACVSPHTPPSASPRAGARSAADSTEESPRESARVREAQDEAGDAAE